jgi:hypothetical protein
MKQLLTVELQLDYHRKYLSPDHQATTVHPEMARKVGEALLAAGAITIIDNGSKSPADARQGYRTFTVRVAALNPLSSLSLHPQNNDGNALPLPALR